MEDRIEFDSVITEKALNDFKMYHVFHNVGIILSVLSVSGLFFIKDH